MERAQSLLANNIKPRVIFVEKTACRKTLQLSPSDLGDVVGCCSMWSWMMRRDIQMMWSDMVGIDMNGRPTSIMVRHPCNDNAIRIPTLHGVSVASEGCPSTTNLLVEAQSGERQRGCMMN
jgi:hypothetical protein